MSPILLIERPKSGDIGAYEGAWRLHKRQAPRPSANIVNTTTPTGEVKALTWRVVEHRDGRQLLKSYLVYDPSIASPQSPQPAILVLHDWDGRDEFENSKAEALARLGYVAYAADIFGRTGGRPYWNDRLVDPFRKNRSLLLKRLQFARDEVVKLPFVHKGKVSDLGELQAFLSRIQSSFFTAFFH